MQFYTDMRKLGQGASGTVFVGTDVRNGEVRETGLCAAGAGVLSVVTEATPCLSRSDFLVWP